MPELLEVCIHRTRGRKLVFSHLRPWHGWHWLGFNLPHIGGLLFEWRVGGAPFSGGVMKCPTDGLELQLAEHPDTGTTMDFYEGTCPKGHKWVVQVENQTGQVSLEEILPGV